MFHFEEIATPPPLTAVDIGAMLLDGVADPLARLSQVGLATVIGFEPLAAECARLNALGVRGRQYLPYAVADGRRRTFHVTNTGMTSSLLAPNVPLVSAFHNLAELMQVVATPEIETRRLDDVAEIRATGCDYLKLDTQGSEVEILTHATTVLSRCLLVQTEVEFVPLYEGQPLFAEIDQLLRSHGFMFHRFLGLSGRPYKPIVVNNDRNQAISQTLWSDAVYVPDLARLGSLPPESLLKLAALLHEVYQSVDLCHVVLAHYDRQSRTALAERYLDRLTGTPRQPG
jgi:FkbM family methyltransferase